MLLENERLDELHRNGYKIIQNSNGFCFGIDAVLLSGFAKVKKVKLSLIYAQVQALYLYYLRLKPMAVTFQLLKFKNKVQIWQGVL